MLKSSVRFYPLAHRTVIQFRSYGQAAPLGADHSTENNLKTETNRLSKTLSKFWEKVTIEENSESIALHLDSIPIRTPLGNSLELPASRKLLALMLLNEWSNLPNLSIKQHSLPLTSLVSRCIDLEVANKPDADPELISKIGGDRERIIKDLLRYLDTDTLLVFSPSDEFEGALRKAQDEFYLPVISAVESYLTKFSKSGEPVKLQILDADIHGLRGNAQAEATRQAAEAYLNTLSMWDLAVFEKTVLTCKSFICGVLLLLNKAESGVTAPGLKYSMEDIARAATLETIYQIERWGEVEDTHDVDKRDIRRNINAAAIVAFKH